MAKGLVEGFSGLFFLGLLVGFFDLFEVAFFAATDEPFGVALELVPVLSDVGGFVAVDGVVEGGLGDAGEEDGELGDDLVGGGEVFEAFFTGGIGISNKVAARLGAEPFDDANVFGEAYDLEDAVEGVAGA